MPIRLTFTCRPWSARTVVRSALFLFSVLLGAGTAGLAHATVRRVPQDHTRITDALAAAADGDTIRVGGGTYSPAANGETYPLNVLKSNIVLLGAGMEITFLDAQAQGAVLQWWPASGGRVSGFTVRGGKAFDGAGIHVIHGAPEIDHNLVTANEADHAGSGIFLNEGADPRVHHNVVWGNRRTSTGTGDPHGIQVYRALGTIEHNLIGRGDSNGIFISAASTSIVRNNIIYQNGTVGDRGRGICHFGTAATVIRNNLFFGNVLASILTLTPGGGMNLNAAQANDLSATDEIDGNVDGDPLFVDASNQVWYLRAGSPAIDTGHPATGSDPDGTPPDIGPLYFDQTTTAVPDPPALVPVTPAAGYPNPFRAGVVLQHEQPTRAPVHLAVMDVQGREIAVLLDGESGPGLVTAFWAGDTKTGAPAPPGVYFAVLRTGGVSYVRKVIRQ